METPQGNTLRLQRVRCSHCQLPLIQMDQGDLLYTLRQDGEAILSQPLPAYSYRTLTDPTSLLLCPRCGAILSQATVVAVLPRTVVTEEGKSV